jgi:pilus assembly protein Flp/PilA
MARRRQARLCRFVGDRSMVILLTRLIKDDRGVTAIEYGLIAALIVIGSLVAINSVSLTLNLNTTFSKVAANL